VQIAGSSGSAGYIYFNLRSSDPSIPSGIVSMFAKSKGPGGTGIYFKDDDTTDELVSRKKAITYGLIF